MLPFVKINRSLRSNLFTADHTMTTSAEEQASGQKYLSPFVDGGQQND